MAFRLKTVRDNQSEVFSIKTVLELLGEKVNDEILIDGKAYRISSYELISEGVGGTAQVWHIENFQISNNGQEQFPFSESFSHTESLFLTVNGVRYSYGVNQDYHIENQVLYWHGEFDLEATDQIRLKYQKTI